VAAEIWILLLLLASAVAAAAGYAYARRGVPSQSDLEALQNELDAARKQAEKVQADVSGHFEQSAVLFGRLAHDYRAFLEHFSKSAQELGISESMAHELLQRADQPLLGQDEDVIDTQASSGAPITQTAASADTETAGSEETAAGDEDGTASADMVAESQLPEPDTEATPAVTDAASEPKAQEPEPPLMEDVVADPEAVASKVVDVNLEPMDADAQPGEEEREEKSRSAGQTG